MYMTLGDLKGALVRELTLAFQTKNPERAIADAAIRAARADEPDLLVRLGEVHRSTDLQAILFALLHDRDTTTALALLDDALERGRPVATMLAPLHWLLAWGAL